MNYTLETSSLTPIPVPHPLGPLLVMASSPSWPSEKSGDLWFPVRELRHHEGMGGLWNTEWEEEGIWKRG